MRKGNATRTAVPAVNAGEIVLGTVRVCTTHGTVYRAGQGCPKC